MSVYIYIYIYTRDMFHFLIGHLFPKVQENIKNMKS